MARRRNNHRAANLAVLALVLVLAAGGAWTGCKEDEESGADAGSKPLATYGAEVTVRVAGRGRVTTQPKGIDCPGECFARIVFVPGQLDALVAGVSLAAEPGAGAHFVKWTFEALSLGVPAAGPEVCSPMKRTSTVPAIDTSALALTLALGETNAEAPPGREAECAAFTKTPLAYAVTATFADDPSDASTVDASTEAIFTTPLPGVEARELGITPGAGGVGVLYWRYQPLGDTRSGIAAASTGGGPVTVVVDASDIITGFDVDAHVVYQRGGQPTLWMIPGGLLGTIQLQNAPFCDAVASHATGIYCRLSGGTQIYLWAPTGGFPSYVFAVPRGFDLAVDDAALYFSEDNGTTGTGNALIRTGPRTGGTGAYPVVVLGQTTPRDLRVRAGYLFWLDGITTGKRSARAASATAASGRETVSVPNARIIAVDPSEPGVFWAGVYTDGSGFSIVRASAITGTTTATMRTKLPAVGGLAVDATHVYWTQGPSVYRAQKPPP